MTHLTTTSDFTPFELTVFRNAGGRPLSKRIELDGASLKSTSAADMYEGTAVRYTIKSLTAFASLLESLAPTDVISLGCILPGAPDKVSVITSKRLAADPTRPATIARTADHIVAVAGSPSLLLIDYDPKGITPETAQFIDAMGGVWEALLLAAPELATAARVVRSSTSSGIYRTDTGEVFPGSRGMHIYIPITDAADRLSILAHIHSLCWLNDLGWGDMAADGDFLERSLVDRLVGGAERLIFEGAPHVIPPLVQDAKARHPIVVEGHIVDGKTTFKPLTRAEEEKLRDKIAAEKKRLAPDMAKKKAEYIQTHSEQIARRTGCDITTARQIIELQSGGTLMPDVLLPFDNDGFAGCTVRDVLAHPDRFDGAKLADPVEGVDYGRGKAMVMVQYDGSIRIRSYAHGETWYNLCGDVEDPIESAQTDFTADPPPAGLEASPRTEIDAMVHEYNKKFCVVNENGKALIYRPKTIPGSRQLSYDDSHTFEDFIKLCRGDFVVVGEKKDDGTPPARKPAAIVWLDHKKRRSFTEGVVFDPSGKPVPKGILNLWQGFNVEPHEGDWSLLRSHVHENICCTNKEHFEYLMNWMARLFQYPEERGEVAVVLHSEGEGTGKGFLANTILRIFGKHGYQIDKPAQLVGRFTGHLRDIVFLFADEAFFAGDKSTVGVLQSTITEPNLSFEAKNRNAAKSRNYLHIMMASNKGWVVPASRRSRRFFVLEVSDAQIQNTKYFGAIAAQMESGGDAAMLYELMHRDISAFEVRDVPVTDALRRQRGQSLDAVGLWLEDILSRGWTDPSTCKWDDVVRTQVLYSSYEEFSKRNREYKPISRPEFGKVMTDVGFSVVRPTTKDKDGKEDRRRGYNVGTLDIARKTFDTHFDLKTDWPDPDDGPDHFVAEEAPVEEEAPPVPKTTSGGSVIQFPGPDLKELGL